MSSITDAIDGAFAEVESAEAVKVEAETPKPEKEAAPQDQETDTQEQDTQFEPFPKKAKNAIRNRDRTISKLQRELQELRAAQAQPVKNEPPKMDDFQTYEEYLEQKLLYKLKQDAPESKQATPAVDVERQQYIAERSQYMAQKSAEYASTIPDYKQVLAENAEYLDYLPEAIQNIFFEAEDAAMAVYNLAKTGDLYALSEMNPYQAAILIGRAEAQRPRPTIPASPKHTPMAGAKGTGKASQTLSSIKDDPEKLMKWLNS